MRYPAFPTIPIAVHRCGRQPLHEQIAGQVGAAVERGLLAAGARLPSTRTLATLLGVSRGVTAAAYELLADRGYLSSQRGSGSYVAIPAPPERARPVPPASPVARPADRHGHGAVTDLRPGQVDTGACPLPAWRAAWRRASFARPPAEALPPLGLPELRAAIAEHLGRTRALPPTGREIVVTNSRAHGLRIIREVLRLRGPQLAVEEPVLPALVRAAGGDADAPVALPVDAAGARLADVPAQCRAMVLAPDANVPLGHVLSARRRRAAATWALATGGHLLEITCDEVFRPEASRLPRLYDAADRATVVLGDFGGLLGPALSIGYAVVPRELVGDVERQLTEHAEQPSYVAQLALASLLRDGVVGRLMHRLGHRYAVRRRIVDAALAALPWAAPGAPGAAGTRVLYLPDRLVAPDVAGHLRGRGVRVDTLDPYHFSGRPVPPALVVGFGHQAEPALRRSLSRLVAALTELAGGDPPRARPPAGTGVPPGTSSTGPSGTSSTRPSGRPAPVGSVSRSRCCSAARTDAPAASASSP